MIAMVAPGKHSCEHTLNTCRYADRVKELAPKNNKQVASYSLALLPSPPPSPPQLPFPTAVPCKVLSPTHLVTVCSRWATHTFLWLDHAQGGEIVQDMPYEEEEEDEVAPLPEGNLNSYVQPACLRAGVRVCVCACVWVWVCAFVRVCIHVFYQATSGRRC